MCYNIVVPTGFKTTFGGYTNTSSAPGAKPRILEDLREGGDLVSEHVESGSRLAHQIDEHVGRRIRLRRTLLGLTQEQLAAALAISYQQVQKYETGANRVSAGRLYQIAQHLSVDVGYFFEGLEPTADQDQLPHGGRNRPAIELVKNFSEIDDPSVRGAVSNLVRTLTTRQGQISPQEDEGEQITDTTDTRHLKASQG